MMTEGSRDVLQHLIQADYNSPALAVVTLQTLTRQSKTPTYCMMQSLKALGFQKLASLLQEDGYCAGITSMFRNRNSIT